MTDEQTEPSLEVKPDSDDVRVTIPVGHGLTIQYDGGYRHIPPSELLAMAETDAPVEVR